MKKIYSLTANSAVEFLVKEEAKKAER